MASPADQRRSDTKFWEIYKFYQGSAEKAKSSAWAHTTWILAINAGILAFAFNLYAQDQKLRGFIVIEFISASVGVALSGFLIYLLFQLGQHIRDYWTRSGPCGNAVLATFLGSC